MWPPAGRRRGTGGPHRHFKQKRLGRTRDRRLRPCVAGFSCLPIWSSCGAPSFQTFGRREECARTPPHTFPIWIAPHVTHGKTQHARPEKVSDRTKKKMVLQCDAIGLEAHQHAVADMLF